MATINFSTAVRTARATALNTAIGANAKIEFYTGTIPASPDTAVSTQTKLGTATGNASGFGTVTNGVLTAGAITQDSAADATGTATWARISTSGNTAVFDVDVSDTGGNGAIKLNTTAITLGGPLAVNSFVITEG